MKVCKSGNPVQVQHDANLNQFYGSDGLMNLGNVDLVISNQISNQHVVEGRYQQKLIPINWGMHTR